MKNIITILLLIAAFLTKSIESRAVTITIDVKNDFFDPSFVTANVGDVIEWEWKEGTHTTSSDTVPAGAIMWDSPINSTSQTFSYTIAMPGHYHYFCTIHGLMMSGVIEVSGVTGIPGVSSDSQSYITINSADANHISVHYRFTESQQTKIALYNLAGNKTLQLVDQILPAGDYSEEYRLSGNTPSGVYFLIIDAANLRLTRKVVVQ